MADAGSGILLPLNPLTALVCGSCGSSVSRERCCKDRGGGGDRSTIPVGMLRADIPADIGPRLGGDWGWITWMASPVGLTTFLAVRGVRVMPGVGTVPAVPVEPVEGVDPV